MSKGRRISRCFFFCIQLEIQFGVDFFSRHFLWALGICARENIAKALDHFPQKPCDNILA